MRYVCRLINPCHSAFLVITLPGLHTHMRLLQASYLNAVHVRSTVSSLSDGLECASWSFPRFLSTKLME